MRESCKRAWLKYRDSREETAALRTEKSKEIEEAKDKIEREEEERIEKLKEDLKTKNNFYPPSLMKRVYANASEAKRGSGEKSDKN